MSRYKKVVVGNQVWIHDADNKLIGYGGTGYDSPLSNYFRKGFDYCGKRFRYVENALQWSKAMLFNDTEKASKILEPSCTPTQAKNFGRQINNFHKKAWLEFLSVEFPNILYAKFSQNGLKNWLLNTENAKLAKIALETENGKIVQCDEIWGIGLGPNSTEIINVETWFVYGQNILGQSLMLVREKLAKEQNSAI